MSEKMPDQRPGILSSHFWEYQLTVLLIRVVAPMRLASALLLGRLLGYLAFDVLRIRRKVAVENLSKAFSERSHKDIVDLARKTYAHLGRMMIEFCRFPVLAQRSGLDDLVMAEGVECLEKARQGGRGAVLVSGHFGNWEIMGAKIAALGFPVNVLVTHQKNEAIDRLMNQHRRMMNVQPFWVGAPVKETLRALRNNAFIGIIADQDAGKQGLFVEFLGRRASSPQGPAAIALKERCPLILAIDVMEPCGRHRVFFEPLLEAGTMAYTPENVKILIEKFNKRLQDYVRQYPDQWFWMHRKWKTRPEGEAK